jgi:intracellular multiplication protein IcmJ
MRPIKLMAQPGAWRVFAARKNDSAFQKFSKRVLARDNYTCQFCGFQAQDYQEIVNLDNNYYNNKLTNLAVACCFCTQCFFLDAIGDTDFGGGTLIYLPEIEQANLNIFCHVIFCAITNGTAYKTSSQAIYRTLKFRSQVVEDQFGEGCSQPSKLGRLIVESAMQPEQMEGFLAKIRLLPSRNRFRKQIEHWATTALQGLSAGEEAEKVTE